MCVGEGHDLHRGRLESLLHGSADFGSLWEEEILSARRLGWGERMKGEGVAG